MDGASIPDDQINNYFLQAVYDAFPNGVAVLGPVLDVSGRIVDFRVKILNAQIANAIPDKHYQNKSYEVVLPMMAEAKISHRLKQVAESGISAKFEASYGYNKAKRWFQFNAVKRNDLLVVITEDITDRKIAEQISADQLAAVDEKQNLYHNELRKMEDLMLESEQRFRTMIEKAPVAIGLTRGNEFIFESINEPMIRLIGKTNKKQVLGRSLAEVLPEIQQQAVTTILHKVIRTGETFHGTEIPADLIIDGKLTEGYFDISYTRFFDSDGVARILHMAIDVTQQVLAKRAIQISGARLKSIIEQTPAATLVAGGEDLIIEQANKPMTEIIGREDVIGRPLPDIMPASEGSFKWEELKRIYTEGGNFDQHYVPIQKDHNGVQILCYYNISVRSLKEAGKTTGIILIANDVTEQYAILNKPGETR